jgi:hypothetical protein
MVPVSPPESHVSPAPTRPVPSASSVAAPEVQKNGGLTSPREFREKLNEPDKNAALPSQSSGIPSAAAPLTGNHEFSPSTIEKIVSIHLVEGRACLDKKNFECAIAKAETALQLAPENGVAGALLKDARAAQQKAWEASELE